MGSIDKKEFKNEKEFLEFALKHHISLYTTYQWTNQYHFKYSNKVYIAKNNLWANKFVMKIAKGADKDEYEELKTKAELRRIYGQEVIMFQRQDS